MYSNYTIFKLCIACKNVRLGEYPRETDWDSNVVIKVDNEDGEVADWQMWATSKAYDLHEFADGCFGFLHGVNVWSQLFRLEFGIGDWGLG